MATRESSNNNLNGSNENKNNNNSSSHSLHRMRRRSTVATVPQKELDSMLETFRIFDEDGSGSIDGPELKNVMQHLGYELNDSEVDDLLKQVDIDNSGVLEFDEFVQLLRLYKEAAQYRLEEEKTFQPLSAKDLRIVRSKQVANYPVDSLPVILWHALMVIFLVVHWIIVLFSDTLTDDDTEDLMKQLIPFEVICTLFLAFDIFVSMRVGEGEADFDNISRGYLMKFMIFDLAALLPLNLILLAAQSNPSFSAVRVLWHLRLARVPKQLLTYFSRSGRLEATRSYIKIQFHYLPMFSTFVSYVCFVHMCTIIYYAIRKDSIEPVSYTEALYYITYSVTGVGYGTIVSNSTGERIYGIVLCFISQAFAALVVGGVVKVVAQGDVEATKRHHISYTSDMGKLFRLPVALTAEILGFREHLEDDSLSEAYKELIENLPFELQSNISLFVRMRLIVTCPLFRDAHRSTHVAIAQQLDTFIYRPQEVIFYIGDESTTMHFISYGFIVLRRRDGGVEKVMKAGDFFGEDGVLTGFSEKKFLARTVTYCEVFSLTRLSFLSIVRQFPAFGVMMRKAEKDYGNESPVDDPLLGDGEVPRSHVIDFGWANPTATTATAEAGTTTMTTTTSATKDVDALRETNPLVSMLVKKAEQQQQQQMSHSTSPATANVSQPSGLGASPSSPSGVFRNEISLVVTQKQNHPDHSRQDSGNATTLVMPFEDSSSDHGDNVSYEDGKRGRGGSLGRVGSQNTMVPRPSFTRTASENSASNKGGGGHSRNLSKSTSWFAEIDVINKAVEDAKMSLRFAADTSEVVLGDGMEDELLNKALLELCDIEDLLQVLEIRKVAKQTILSPTKFGELAKELQESMETTLDDRHHHGPLGSTTGNIIGIHGNRDGSESPLLGMLKKNHSSKASLTSGGGGGSGKDLLNYGRRTASGKIIFPVEGPTPVAHIAPQSDEEENEDAAVLNEDIPHLPVGADDHRSARSSFDNQAGEGEVPTEQNGNRLNVQDQRSASRQSGGSSASCRGDGGESHQK